MQIRDFRLFLIMAMLLLGGLALGCDPDLTPALRDDRPFTLYGVLSPDHDSQWVRIYPVTDRLEPVSTDGLNIDFASIDLTSGETRQWTAGFVSDIGDQLAHAYWAPFAAEYGHSYRLVASSPEGDSTYAEVYVPQKAELVPRPPTVNERRSALLDLQGDVPQIFGIEVLYRVLYRYVIFNPLGEPVDDEPELRTITVTEGIRKDRSDGKWWIRIDFRSGYEAIRRDIEKTQVIAESSGIRLEDLTIRLVAANAEWNPPDGIFDPEILMHPEVMTNVENGFGFVGAGYELRLDWMPEQSVLDNAGFRVH